MIETKAEKFVRILDQRLPRALKAIELIGNLGSPNYESSTEERSSVVSELFQATQNVAREFRLEQDPEPVPAPAPDVPEVFELTREEDLHMLRIGPRIGAAIECLEDQKPEEAKQILLQLMVS